MPELRIIEDDLWQDVKERQGLVHNEMAAMGSEGEMSPERARRPSYLLSGMVLCDCCGASYTLIIKTRYGCSAVRNKGEAVCQNRATISREAVEARVLGGLRTSYCTPT